MCGGIYLVDLLKTSVMSELVKLLVCRTHRSYPQVIFPAGQGDLSKDATMASWELDHPIVCYYMSLANSKFGKFGPLKTSTKTKNFVNFVFTQNFVV